MAVTKRETVNLCIKTEGAQLEQTLIALSPEAYTDFVKRLDAPPLPNQRLRKTMQTNPPWKEA
jgi:uncharacterized protein (DUF1778 family)